MTLELSPADAASRPLSHGQLFRVWLALGVQSFGGGAATLALIRRAVVEQRHWLSDAEFVRDWALCQVAPGINLLALTVLIGRKVAGAWGIALCLMGLLLPSVAITVLLTACYAHFRGLAIVQAAVRGVIPATVGLGLLTGYQMALPLLAAARRQGRGPLLVGLALLAAGSLIVAATRAPVVLVLCAAGCVGGLFQWAWEPWREKRRRGTNR